MLPAAPWLGAPADALTSSLRTSVLRPPQMRSLGAAGASVDPGPSAQSPRVRRCLAPIACPSSQGHKGPAPEVFVGTTGGVAWGGSDPHASL